MKQKYLNLMYITNRIEVAEIADEAGVDRVWIDLEYKGKEERQHGMNSVKSKHSLEDIRKIKPILSKAKLMVRINPWDNESRTEIENVIEYGADYIMLPMYKSADEVKTFLKCINGRAKTILLLETKEAAERIDTYIDLPGIDEIHIGLNDLHLAYGKKFMFELLIDGTVAELCSKISGKEINYGFGGFARIGHGILPAEMILTEHYALGSSMAILSRGFCDANIVQNPKEVEDIFCEGIAKIREYEDKVRNYSIEEFEMSHKKMKKIIEEIIRKMEEE